jgi:antitoxin ParD1/3/4
MTISFSLTPEQQAWLDAHVARGDFKSVEEAAQRMIEERIAELEATENDGLAWAKPYVDEAIASVEKGEGLTLEEHRARNTARLDALKD